MQYVSAQYARYVVCADLVTRVIAVCCSSISSHSQVIHQHPARQQSLDQIQQLEQKLETLSTQHESLSQQLSLRRKQCHLLVFAIQQLMESLDQEQQGDRGSDGDRNTPMET